MLARGGDRRVQQDCLLRIYSKMNELFSVVPDYINGFWQKLIYDQPKAYLD